MTKAAASDEAPTATSAAKKTTAAKKTVKKTATKKTAAKKTTKKTVAVPERLKPEDFAFDPNDVPFDVD